MRKTKSAPDIEKLSLNHVTSFYHLVATLRNKWLLLKSSQSKNNNDDNNNSSNNKPLNWKLVKKKS